MPGFLVRRMSEQMRERLTPAMACSTTIRFRARRLLNGLFRDFLPLGRRGMRLRVASKSPVTENSRATGKMPFFKVNATLIMPSARSGLSQKHNAFISDSDDIFDGVSLFAPTVTGLAGHAVLGTATRAVCAIDDKRQGRVVSQRLCEVMGFSFWQAEFAFEGSFEDGCQAVRPLAGLCLAHPKEKRHDVEGGIDFEPPQF